MTKTIALVTGASSGLGFETSLMLAEKGFQVYATMRNLKQIDLKNEATKKKCRPNHFRIGCNQIR